MRDTFMAYYKPTDDEIKEIWSDGIIILDTNTLLNVFRYTPATREDFLGVLEKLRNSLWIPHQVGYEFHMRRLDVISATDEAFSKVEKSFKKAREDIRRAINEYKKHPSLNRPELESKVDSFFIELSSNLEAKREEHSRRVNAGGDTDRALQRITNLFEGRVGEGFTADEKKSQEVEAKDRYDRKVPPGYKDQDDSNPNQYGDFFIWKEILRKGHQDKKPVIFVTDDAKDDWWWRHNGKTQGPRVELVNEYWENAGCRIHFYEPLKFLEYAKDQTSSDIRSASFDEVQQVSNAGLEKISDLLERREVLESRKERLLEKRGDRKLDHFTSVPIGKLLEDLRQTEMRRHEMESVLSNLGNEVEELTNEIYDGTSEVDPRDSVVRLSRLRGEISDVEMYIVSLTKRRDKIKRQIDDSDGYDKRVNEAIEMQLGEIQEEIHALDRSLAHLDSH